MSEMMSAVAAGSTLHDLLRSTFGFSSFRGQQEAVISRIMAGEHTLALMPTGAGKSLCYQIPALARSGTAIVISPLIALMHDQIRAAKVVGIRAASITSVDDNRAQTVEQLRAGELDLLYVAPERAALDSFHSLVSQIEISLFAIDEAHCVSEWGHDFRPDYRGLRLLLDRFDDVPRLALTATADEVTRKDVLKQLGIAEDGLIKAGFDRPNIQYAISHRSGVARQIADFIKETPGAGIIYANSRKGAEELAAKLADTGRPISVYHAGLSPEKRAANQAAFVASEDMIMVATIAFGMGIDKPDVRFVIHSALPKSIEAYYQESGRAGRDGDPAQAQMFWSAADFSKARQWLSEVEPSRLPAERERLNALAGLVESAACRRAILLRHFGENPSETCGNCDNCLGTPQILDVSEIAQKLLSAVYRTGQSFGIAYIEKVLRGQQDQRITSRGHDRLSVYGIVGDEEAFMLRPTMRHLTAFGMVETTEHGGLKLSGAAREILRGQKKVTIAQPPKTSTRRSRRNAAALFDLSPQDNPLFEALRAKRKSLASENAIPAYIIFHDSVLRAMASQRPASRAALGDIQGVGEKKLESWGDHFLEVIEAFA